MLNDKKIVKSISL